MEFLDVNVYKDLNPDNYSSESTKIYRLSMINVVKYFDKNELVKIEVTFSGDRQDLKSEYYFEENELFFVFKELTVFDYPKWSNSFDPDEKKSQENRYYFKSSNMILWVDRLGNKQERRRDEYILFENQIYLDSQLYKHYKEN